MIICGWKKTRMFGGTFKIIQDFINIVHCVREMCASRLGKEYANRIVLACVKMALFVDTPVHEESTKELFELIKEAKESHKREVMNG